MGRAREYSSTVGGLTFRNAAAMVDTSDGVKQVLSTKPGHLAGIHSSIHPSIHPSVHHSAHNQSTINQRTIHPSIHRHATPPVSQSAHTTTFNVDFRQAGRQTGEACCAETDACPLQQCSTRRKHVLRRPQTQQVPGLGTTQSKLRISCCR